MEIYFRYPCSNRAFTGIVFLFVLIFGMNANLPVPVVIGDDRMVTPVSSPFLIFNLKLSVQFFQLLQGSPVIPFQRAFDDQKVMHMPSGITMTFSMPGTTFVAIR